MAIPSVSSDVSLRPETIDMMYVAEKDLINLGCSTKIHRNPCNPQISPDGLEFDYPPILTATYPKERNPSYKTVLIYGHLDVQPAKKSDGWDTEPFEQTEKTVDGRLQMFGRGTTDDKGPVLAWIIALEQFQRLGIELPLNLKFCLEGMEETSSVGLAEFINQEKDSFFADVDATIVSDNYWLRTKKPCLTYGLRGIHAFGLIVECASADMHSGQFGGVVHEANVDVFKILASLVDSNGFINVDGIYDKVDELSPEEAKTYENLDFDIEEFSKSFSISKLSKNTKEKILQHRWRFPSLSLHGIEGAFSGPGQKTVIPARVEGKFTIRTVPSMTGDDTFQKVKNFIDKQFKKINSPNKYWVKDYGGGDAWVDDINSEIFKASHKAVKDVYKIDPDYTREGGSIPVVNLFAKCTGNPVCLIPMGCGDDRAHSQNEKLDVRNFVEGTKVLGASLMFYSGKWN